MNELEKHIKFVEKQLLVYRYHEHPDVLKMEALHKYLLNIKNTNNENPKSSSAPNNICSAHSTDDKTTDKSPAFRSGTLFDTSEFIKKKSMYD